MLDKAFYGNPPPIKSCIIHPAIPCTVQCEHQGDENFARVTYGMCASCVAELNSNIEYIRVINNVIEERMKKLKERL